MSRRHPSIPPSHPVQPPRYMVEWLEYHLLYGVQHVYLLSNECEEGAHARMMDLLAPVRCCLALPP